jgi:addiction module HigA family antidote
MKRMRMHNPPHPGEIVREECLKPLGLTVGEAAAGLGVSRKVLSDIVNERAGISPLMAYRLAKAFGGSADVWLGVQMEYELARARRTAAVLKIRTFVRRRSAGARIAAA